MDSRKQSEKHVQFILQTSFISELCSPFQIISPQTFFEPSDFHRTFHQQFQAFLVDLFGSSLAHLFKILVTLQVQGDLRPVLPGPTSKTMSKQMQTWDRPVVGVIKTIYPVTAWPKTLRSLSFPNSSRTATVMASKVVTRLQRKDTMVLSAEERRKTNDDTLLVSVLECTWRRQVFLFDMWNSTWKSTWSCVMNWTCGHGSLQLNPKGIKSIAVANAIVLLLEVVPGPLRQPEVKHWGRTGHFSSPVVIQNQPIFTQIDTHWPQLPGSVFFLGGVHSE